MLIRTEQVQDHSIVNDLHDTETRERINALRHNLSEFMPEFSIVCEDNGVIVGHAMLFPIRIARDKNVAFCSLFMLPMAIRESHYDLGVNNMLMKNLLGIAVIHMATSIITDKCFYMNNGFKPSDGTIYSKTGKRMYIREILGNGGIAGISGCIEADENLGI